jgi:AAA+ superfamily predicted ATPase
MTYNLKLYSSTFREAGAVYMRKNLDWILRELHVQSEEDIIRLRPPEWMGDFLIMAFKKLYLPNHSGIVNSNINATAMAIGEKIDSVVSIEGLDGNNIEFHQSHHVGEWYMDSSEYMISIKLHDLFFPFIVYNLPVAQGSHSGDRNEIIVPKKWLDDFVSYAQTEEKKSGRIIVNVFGQKTYTIKPMEWENLTLDESINFLIKKDLERFMQNKPWFSDKGIPYRRGYLLHGPPGNGKTTVIRAMLTQAKLPAFTIKKMYDPDAMYYFEDMFEAASKSGGAFVILEDIDRSFAPETGTKESTSNSVPFSVFLNCLDGISDSDGVIVIATANSPQILDKAILERPGRFDRVVHFPNPSIELRKRYIASHLPSFEDASLDIAARKCDNMSFAQLREIYIIASQLAEDSSRPVEVQDVLDAHERLVLYTKKASGRDAGYK